MTRHEDATKISHFRNLCAILMADGQISSEEGDLLMALGNRWGLDQRQIDDILLKPGVTEYAVATDAPTRMEQLYDLVTMMLVDGKIHPNEMRLCQSMARVLGFPARLVQSLVALLQYADESSLDSEEIRRRTLDLLQRMEGE